MSTVGLLMATATAAAQSPDTTQVPRQPPGFARALAKQFPQVYAPAAPNPARDPNFVRIDIANTARADRLALGSQVGNYVPISSESVPPTPEEKQELFGGEVSLPPITGPIPVPVAASAPTVFARGPMRVQRLAGVISATALNRGALPELFVVEVVRDVVRVRNRAGVVLMEISSDADVAEWPVVSLVNLGLPDTPGFCVSGVGHPVWGRQWCFHRGFGVGSERTVRWARVIESPGVVLLRRSETPSALGRRELRAILGDVVFNRLALQAITLGLVEPLTGGWLGDASGPYVLSIASGAQTIAEVVDLDRDTHADLLLIALRPR